MQHNEEYDITAAFKRIEDELIDSMVRNMDRHRAEEDDEGILWSQWQVEQLKALEQYKKNNQKKYSKQFQSLNKRIEALIRLANDTGNMEQEIEILEAIKNGFRGYHKASGTMQAEFFRLNERKLEALIEATTNDMKKAETAVLRMANDKYRKAIFNAQVYANTGAGTYEKAVDMSNKDMLAAGLNCIEYANGARHTLSDYAEMAIRTASKRAYLQGEGQKRQEWGITTVIMNKRGNPCPKCLPFVGKVLIDDVWSGGKAEDGDYPLMSYAISRGLYHPRCKDSHTTYFPGIYTADDTWTKDELEEIGENAKLEAKQQYAERQEEKYERLARHSLDKDNRRIYKDRTDKWKKEIEEKESGFSVEDIERKMAELYDRRIEEEELEGLLSSKELIDFNKITGGGYLTFNAGEKLPDDVKQKIVNKYSKLLDKYKTGCTKVSFEKRFTDADVSQFARGYTIRSGATSQIKILDQNIDDLKNELSKSTLSGFNIKGLKEEDYPLYYLTHEFGHTLAPIEEISKVDQNYKKVKKFSEEIKAIYAEYNSELRSAILEEKTIRTQLKSEFSSALMSGDMEKLSEIQGKINKAVEKKNLIKISDYAAQNPDEFLAESFALHELSEETSPYAEKVMDVVNRYFGR